MKKISKFIMKSPYIVLILGFLITILIGTILLMLPISTKQNIITPFTIALFTSTSAVCVTGLTLVDTLNYFSIFGQIIILILIQIGGIGIIAFIAICIHRFKGKLSLKSTLIVNEAYNNDNLDNGVNLIKKTIKITFIIETIGALLLSIFFIPKLGCTTGLFYGVFHSISAFNNAGFDLIGNSSSLTSFVSNSLFNLIIITLILLGGLGFICILDIIYKKKFKKFSLTSKVSLTVNLVVLIISFVIFFLSEYNNYSTLGELNLIDKMTSSLFLSVTPRTAGFSNIDMNNLGTGSMLLMIALMFIGASSGSTGGGLKVTTIAIPFLILISVFKGKEDVVIFGRQLSIKFIHKAISIIVIYLIIFCIAILTLSATETATFKEIIFEVASAINTVGLSLGLTPRLTTIGKYIIILLMFIGRVGPLTIVMTLSLRNKHDTKIRYPEEKILIG